MTEKNFLFTSSIEEISSDEFSNSDTEINNKKIKCNDLRGDIDINKTLPIINEKEYIFSSNNNTILSPQSEFLKNISEINNTEKVIKQKYELINYLNNNIIFKELNKYLTISILNIDNKKINLILNFYNKCLFNKKFLFSFITNNIKNNLEEYKDYNFEFVLIINGKFF